MRGITAILAATATLLAIPADARQMRKEELNARRVEAAKRWKPSPVRRAVVANNITFSNPKASRTCLIIALRRTVLSLMFTHLEFYVDGKSIPDVDFDVGPSWSGLLPISSNANETRKVAVTHILP